jgi:hypothetical protein
MKVYIPFRKDNAVYWANALSARFISTTPGSAYLSDFIAFARKKDAVAYIEEQNAKTAYPHEYKIVAFESK